MYICAWSLLYKKLFISLKINLEFIFYIKFVTRTCAFRMYKENVVSLVVHRLTLKELMYIYISLK